MEAIEQLIKQSSLLQLRAKMEKKYKEAPEIMDNYSAAVRALQEMNEEGNLAPNMSEAIMYMSMAACHGMTEAKRIIQNLEHIVKCSVQRLPYDFSEKTIQDVDETEENLKLTNEEIIEAEQGGKKTIKSFIDDKSLHSCHSSELFVNYPYHSKLSYKSSQSFLLALALHKSGSYLCNYAFKDFDTDNIDKEFEKCLLELVRSNEICLEYEKPWALDLMCYNLLAEADLCHDMNETDLEYFVLLELYYIMHKTYYSKMIHVPYPLSLYMDEKELNHQNDKMKLMTQVFKKLYLCLQNNEVPAENREKMLSLIRNDLHCILIWGSDAYYEDLFKYYLDFIWKDRDEDVGLYKLLMSDGISGDTPEMILDTICEGLYGKLVNLECLKFKSEPCSVFDWTRTEHESLQLALKILEKGVPCYSEEDNVYFKAMAKGLNTVYAVRCNTRSAKERLDELKVIANELRRNSLFELLAFAHYVYYNNQGNLKFASLGALDILKNAGITDSKIAAALENGMLMI